MRSAYVEHERVALDCSGEGRTHQSFKKECDVNGIMARFEKTGVMTHVAKVEGRYGDFLSASGYHEAMNMVVEAQQAFDSLPAKLRKRFGNDPASFLEFVQDPANENDMVEMGLLPKAPPEPTPLEVVIADKASQDAEAGQEASTPAS